MSIDFQLAFPCPHLTVEERISLEPDRRSLLTRQPVASGDFVTLTANDDIVIPRSGFQSSARIMGFHSGPFHVRRGRARLTVGNNRGVLADFLVPEGRRVSAQRIVEALTKALRQASVGVQVLSRNGVLVFGDVEDRGASSRVTLRGPAAESLGFTQQVADRGRSVFPAWEMAERDDVVNTSSLTRFVRVSTRFPRFTRAVKSNPVFKITYATIQQRCLRCRTTGIENDYRFNPSGEPLLIGDENLLNQALLKILTTRRGSNPFHTYYGSRLLDQIGQKAQRGAGFSINEDVTRTVDTFRELQKAQGQFQEITARERLAAVLSINVTPSPSDPTVFRVHITATNASGQPVVIDTVFAAPGTAALSGTNGLSLGLEGRGLSPETTRRGIFDV